MKSPAGRNQRGLQIWTRSTLAVLKPFPSARLAVLLALAHARIAGEQAVGLERRTQVGVGLQQGASNAMPHGASLAGRTAPRDVYPHVKFPGRLGDRQRLRGEHPQRLDRKIVVKGTIVDRDLTGAGGEADA